MSARQEVKERASDLELEESIQIICPFCEEDWQAQQQPFNWMPNKSCSITRDTLGILYNCFRAGCSRGHGFIPTVYVDNSVTKSQKYGKKFAARLYPCETRDLLEEEYAYLEKVFEFDKETVQAAGILYSPERSSYVFPIRTWNGYNVGLVDRDFSGRRETKAITYWFNDVPKIYFTAVQGDTVLIVEDIPSAIKASKFIPAVALLGTSLGDNEVNLIRKMYSKVIIALDEDAINKAVKFMEKYSFYFQSFTVLPLSKDIKDTTYIQLEAMLCK